MDVGTAEEGGIEDFVTLDDRLLIVKQRAVYEFILADKVDPKRTNASIPNTQQQVLDIGSESPLLCRTLLTGKLLFLPTHLKHVIDCQVALNHTFGFLQELAAMTAERDLLNREIENAIASIEGSLLSPGFKIPKVANFEARSKAFLYRGHDAVKALLDIVRLFYGKTITHADSLLAYVQSNLDSDNPFREFTEGAVPMLRFVWNVRNAVAHPKPEMRVIAKNFLLAPNGSLGGPTIEVVHPDTPQPCVPVIPLFDNIIESLQLIFEEAIALLCDQHVRFGDFQVRVSEIPEAHRRQKHIRFSYVVNLQGEWRLLG